MPRLNGILETAVYVDDMERAKRFYEDIMGLSPMFADNRLTAYDVAGRSVLLVFQRGGSVNAAKLPSGTIPGHDGSGPLHYAFAVGADELDAWEEHLREREVEIEGRVGW